MAAVKCPRCGLFNPDSAQRCDCGYDFETNQAVVGILALAAGDLDRIIGAVLWSVIVWWLYSEMVAKKNWARLWLVVLTFPLGLLVGLSSEARLYCLQK